MRPTFPSRTWTSKWAGPFGWIWLRSRICLDGVPCPQFQNTYRVSREGPLRVLQSLHGQTWNDLYAFLPEPRYPVDFELANHYTSTHPDSRFVKTLTAQLPGPQVRRILRDRTYIEIRGDRVESRDLAAREVIPLLRKTFGIDVPKGAKFRAFRRIPGGSLPTFTTESGPHPAKNRR